ncbi:hypothetical protein BTK96_000820 [Burkholderia pyrrocinia]|uniref:hypothetical protein n=1 Tax=Burkholderia sp. IT-111MI5 TaxID=3026439 RepID=UPI002A2A2811|nr:hypothetical protein [Burkholderia pyrrocinia]EKS9893591.1 hypothetical protein [Burkholderia pyrrocinia]EKS9905763.1 hypothetical protein [Burkholderia pyrrocinia]
MQASWNTCANRCFDPELNGQLRQALPHISWFSHAGRGGDRFEQLRTNGFCLSGRDLALDWSPVAIVTALRSRVLCPGPFPVFASLAFLNQFQCLGSFNQVQYLAQMKQALTTLRGFDGDSFAAVPTDGLTLGRVRQVDGTEVYPMDVLLGESIEWDRDRSVGDFASTVILKRRWLRSAFADAGSQYSHA